VPAYAKASADRAGYWVLGAGCWVLGNSMVIQWLCPLKLSLTDEALAKLVAKVIAKEGNSLLQLITINYGTKCQITINYSEANYGPPPVHRSESVGDSGGGSANATPVS
jgi:hypothetical protein